jgi:hypothetical protein
MNLRETNPNAFGLPRINTETTLATVSLSFVFGPRIPLKPVLLRGRCKVCRDTGLGLTSGVANERLRIAS